ncbi:polynucleotide 5'-hydroxyl-kinase NOL9 [Elaeis guineensis]|uniref:Polynucleotide 5'-hydroxyl-kinase NOL9 n=1 Tax=Elaeis guineensis var. tenera TaxID=51953 RepID=A0A6I9S389_ELAGV|nr:polynucleotide 5'-hydroxyl-kinase NOL9 [Elaeis guineensis]XP_010936380.1 polynucleotide 5'-hydroxyl-kinase NOL9 [Elaeis guineensis]XP_010936451.1 polynucleotide 5'-hydroxyl-kinase NOL9 [Elaeis guineensis]XP_029119051.1 polynucleotide 5'-hydroxyl-kinase NOL9 [Elaeis guineensis]
MAGVEKRAGKASSDPGWVIPQWWEETAEAIAYDSCTWPPPITLVCGPGNSGKSTFSRLLLNTLLPRYKRVSYLDTDVGQPEFTTPGCVSLHIIDKQTPDLTILYLKTPERCLFFGDICAKKDPKVYLNCIFSLYDHFLSECYQSTELDNPAKPMLPLVINTSGWVKGIGYDMLVKMLRYMSPSHVVQIRISAESKNLPTGTFWLNGSQKHSAKLFEICAAPKESLNRQVLIKKDACMIRDLRLIAYFRQCLPRDLDISTYQELVHSLALIPPCEVLLPRIKVQHLHCQPSSSDLYHGLDATVVGLAISSWMPTSSEHCTPWCVGLGLVRAVDISKDILYLITPVARSTLEKVDLLLRGSIEIPVCLLQGCRNSSPFMSRNVPQNFEQPELDEHVARAEKQLSELRFR